MYAILLIFSVLNYSFVDNLPKNLEDNNMDSILDMIPPVSGDKDSPISDPIFEHICDEYMRNLVLDQPEFKFKEKSITFNEKFGFVYRIDFVTPDSDSTSINRILLWRLKSDDLAEYIGFNVLGITELR
jgi:hypothetical protein